MPDSSVERAQEKSVDVEMGERGELEERRMVVMEMMMMDGRRERVDKVQARTGAVLCRPRRDKWRRSWS